MSFGLRHTCPKIDRNKNWSTWGQGKVCVVEGLRALNIWWQLGLDYNGSFRDSWVQTTCFP